ncbi:Zinc finger BED domain-containing protein 4 [Chionoecetes opilio]|uniref:Zinc finger BED domain-containing protein 4 n=1 Tax=Chionoecetes opilio TaxID=41210 RepID=A0A8J4YFU9_CHIOP|nr:Zinc finger BED domain-containing protein 4 [Chionoecetes opilio]
MLLDCETRWGSVYTMLERASQQKQAVKLAEDDPDLAIVAESKLTPNDWDLIPKVIALLGPIYASSLSAESDTASVSDIIPLTKKMKIEIQRVSQSGIGTMKDALLNQIDRYLEGGDTRAHFVKMEQNPLMVIATLLDPRYKTAGFQNKEEGQRGKQKLLTLIISELTQEVSGTEMVTETADPADHTQVTEVRK